MYLQKLKKRYPQDFILYSPFKKIVKGKEIIDDSQYYFYVTKRKKEVFKKQKIQRVQYVRLEHHETYILIKSLMEYDLTIPEDRSEVLSALTIAMLNDPYKIIFDSISRFSKAIKVLNETHDLSKFTKDLNDLKGKLGKIEKADELAGRDSLGLGSTDYIEPEPLMITED